MENDIELDPTLERAWNYANTFLFENIHTESQLYAFINAPDIKKKFRQDEREFMVIAWNMIKLDEEYDENPLEFEFDSADDDTDEQEPIEKE